jgi:hypothetical protein
MTAKSLRPLANPAQSNEIQGKSSGFSSGLMQDVLSDKGQPMDSKDVLKQAYMPNGTTGLSFSEQ